MSRASFVLLAALTVAGPAGAARPALLWNIPVPTAGPGAVWGIRADAWGDIALVGTSVGCLATAKLSSATGGTLWMRTRCEQRPSAITGTEALVDASGDIVAIGAAILIGSGNTIAGQRVVVVKYRGADGAVVWERVIDGFAPREAAIDGQGDVLVAAQASDAGLAVALSGSDGSTRWESRGDVPYRHVAAGPAGEAAFSDEGRLNDGTTAITRFARDGAVLWRRTFPGQFTKRFPESLAIDPDGNVLATGGLDGSRVYNRAFTTMKLASAAGEILWSNALDTDGDDVGLSIVARDDGGALATGFSNHAIKTLRYAADGSILWQATHGGMDPNGYDAGYLVRGAGSDAVVAGTVASNFRRELHTIRYDADTGSERWTMPYAAPSAFPRGLATTPDGVVLVLDAGGSVRVLKYGVEAAPARVYQGLWWRSPAGSASGWGLNLAHQGDVLFATWFTYGLDGQGLWMVMPELRNVDGRTFSGTLYRTRGPGFASTPFDRGLVAPTAIGTATFEFTDGDNGRFTYLIFGDGERAEPITREIYAGRVPACGQGTPSAGDSVYRDLWWADPPGSESGWGLNVEHQGEILFVTWFTYDASGAPLWVVGPNVSRTSGQTFSGTLYRTSGATYRSDPWPAQVSVRPVGNVTLAFEDGLRGTFAYTVDGVSGSKRIVRQSFASPGTVCR